MDWSRKWFGKSDRGRVGKSRQEGEFPTNIRVSPQGAMEVPKLGREDLKRVVKQVKKADGLDEDAPLWALEVARTTRNWPAVEEVILPKHSVGLLC